MKLEDVHWIRKQFKNNKVWVAADINGRPIVEKNKVLIKYQLDQENKYWVSQKSVDDIMPESGSRNSIKMAKTAKTRPDQKKKIDNGHPADCPSNTINVYTDGASSGNPGPSGIGVVLEYGGHEREISKYIGIATNNIAELTAIQEALISLKRNDLPVRIFTDSSYACGLLVSGWKAQKNVVLVQTIKELMTRFTNLKIIKVKGHSGIRGNEKADQLATSAISSLKTKAE